MTVFPAISVAYWVVSGVAVACYMLLPIALILIARARLKVGWRYALYGALIFFIFQIVTRVPAVEVGQYFLTPALKSSPVLLYGWLFFLALTAGIFEEVGRYFGYRWFMGREEKTWNKAVMYGLGHGGLESILLIGGLALVTLINVYLISSTKGLIVPLAQRPAAAREIATIAAQPIWLGLLGVWERICGITIHVALSVVVLQVFRRRSLNWLWLAIGLHTLVDGVAVILAQALPLPAVAKDLTIEGVLGVLALGALWLIFALRDHPAATPATTPATPHLAQADGQAISGGSEMSPAVE